MLELKVDLPELPDAKGVKRWMYNFMRKLRMQVKDATPVDSGDAQKSWTIVRRTEGGYSFGNPQPYAHILEGGSQPGKAPWPNVGPKTTLYAGRIYSSQAPGGIFKKARVDDVLAAAMKDLERTFK